MSRVLVTRYLRTADCQNINQITIGYMMNGVFEKFKGKQVLEPGDLLHPEEPGNASYDEPRNDLSPGRRILNTIP